MSTPASRPIASSPPLQHDDVGICVAVGTDEGAGVGAYGVGIVQGVRRYAGSRTSWRVEVRHGNHRLDAEYVRGHGIGGLIVQMFKPDRVSQYRDAGIPVVNVADNHDDRSLPTVISENHAIGVMGAEHLLDLGYRHLAFCGKGKSWYGLRRRDGFRGHVAGGGRTICEHFAVGASPSDLMEDLIHWLQRLPRPIGLMTHSDAWALAVMRACDKAGLEVPRDVAVLGVDNDEGICETWRVPISSVAVNAEKIGYEAAALLDRMMRGEPPPAEPIEIPPIAVEQRESTAGLGVRDRAVAKAVSAMREGIDQPLTIDDLAAALGISRRHLDRRFREALGRTAADELRRLRVERARRLLKETSKNVLEIALDCGFSDANRLNAVFHATLGMSPTAYRRQHGAESGFIAGQDA